MSTVNAVLTGDASGLRAAFAAGGEAVSRFGRDASSAFGRMSGGVAASTVALAGVTAAVGGLALALRSSSEFERYETQFKVLLGSAEKARDRIKELTDFASSTPFELSGVTKASKTLETLTGGALSTGRGLRLTGDLAAASGQDISDLSMWVGRLYDGLQSGRPVGEAMMRLQELGLMSGEVRIKIEDMQKAGLKGDVVWMQAANGFARFAGMMEEQSKTLEGKWSNLMDVKSQLAATLGAPIADALKPILDEIIASGDQLKAKMREWGEQIGGFVTAVYNNREAIMALAQAYLALRALNFAADIVAAIRVFVTKTAAITASVAAWVAETAAIGANTAALAANTAAKGANSAVGAIGGAGKAAGAAGGMLGNIGRGLIARAGGAAAGAAVASTAALTGLYVAGKALADGKRDQYLQKYAASLSSIGNLEEVQAVKALRAAKKTGDYTEAREQIVRQIANVEELAKTQTDEIGRKQIALTLQNLNSLKSIADKRIEAVEAEKQKATAAAQLRLAEERKITEEREKQLKKIAEEVEKKRGSVGEKVLDSKTPQEQLNYVKNQRAALVGRAEMVLSNRMGSDGKVRNYKLDSGEKIDDEIRAAHKVGDVERENMLLNLRDQLFDLSKREDAARDAIAKKAEEETTQAREKTQYLREQKALLAEGAGDEARAEALRLESRELEEQVSLQKSLGVSAAEAKRLAHDRIAAEEAIKSRGKNQKQHSSALEFATDLRVLQLRAAGLDRQADAVEREAKARQEAKRLAEEMGISDRDALNLTRQKMALEEQVNQRRGGRSGGRRRGVANVDQSRALRAARENRGGLGLRSAGDLQSSFGGRIRISDAAREKMSEAATYGEATIERLDQMVEIWKKLGVA